MGRLYGTALYGMCRVRTVKVAHYLAMHDRRLHQISKDDDFADDRLGGEER